MKTGFNMLMWTGHVGAEHRPIIEGLRELGYDSVEIPIFEGTPADYADLGGFLDKLGLHRTGLAAFSSVTINPISPDSAARQAALEHMDWALACCRALGADILAGPMHSTLGHFSGEGPTQDEKARLVEHHRAVGPKSEAQGVTLAIEALNRFECYMLTTMDDLAAHLAAVDHPRIRAMYDTFHANIEEKDPVAAIATIAPYLAHVHISENDRGTPGKGHIDFAPVFAALKRAGYDGALTIEAFGRALPALAAATRVWRDFFPSTDEVTSEGLRLLQQGWRAA